MTSAVFSLLALAAILVLFMAVIRFGGNALFGGLQSRPKANCAGLVVLVLIVLLAALSFGHFFPHCHVWGLRFGAVHC